MKSKVIMVLSYIVLGFTTLSFAGEGKTPKCCKNKEACCETKSACCSENKQKTDCCEANDKCCETNDACCNSEAKKAKEASHCNANNSSKTKKTCCK